MLDPISQFKIQNWFAIKLFSWDISFSNASFFMLLSFVLPVLLVFFACHKRSIIPGKLQAMVECTYMFILDMLEETSGKDGVVYAPFVFSVFIFILMANVLGMLPFCFTITSHIIVTFAIAAIVFVLVTFIGICKHKGRFLSLFFPPGAPLIMAPILVPVELLSYLSRPVSLAVRLFANMMAGHTMLKVFAGFR